MSFEVPSNISRSTVHLFDTGAETNLNYPSLIPHERHHHISHIQNMSLRPACDSPVQVICKTMLLVQLGDLYVCVHFEVVQNLLFLYSWEHWLSIDLSRNFSGWITASYISGLVQSHLFPNTGHLFISWLCYISTLKTDRTTIAWHRNSESPSASIVCWLQKTLNYSQQTAPGLSTWIHNWV